MAIPYDATYTEHNYGFLHMRITTKNKPRTHGRAQSPARMGQAIRLLVMEMSARAKCGETGSSLCVSDILAVLYFRILRINPKKPNNPSRDRFILSKGHAAAGLYAALSLRGFFPKEVLRGHRINGGRLHAHPSKGAIPGIEVSTGSLGHGLSIASGMAEALKGTESKVYVLLGNGECDEGSIWEAARYIGRTALRNIIAIVDDNKVQGYPLARQKRTLNLAKQWSAFGWKVLRVQGHDCEALERALREAGRNGPAVVIADTVAGKGVPEIEHTQRAHYYVPDNAAVLKFRNKKI
ncbi:MAG: transketolase [bacterium]|nr:transketolase [bacterium]